MVSISPKKKLYDAATTGDTTAFQTLVQQDPSLVDQVSFARSRNLLHIAAASGHVEIARMLLTVGPDEMCWWVDDRGMNPVHIAAMKGHVEILKVLLENDLSPAMERLHRGQTVLHLCVKHRQLETLKFLVEKMSDLANVKDDDGEKAFNLAVRCNRDEMIQYLMDKNTVEKSIINDITDMTMVVVGLIAAMAFQAAVSPPGGLWQDDTSSHKAGKAVMGSTHPKLYNLFSRANTTAFISSLLVIFLVALRAQTHALFFVIVIWYATFVSMASIGMSYGASLYMTNPMETQTLDKIEDIVIYGFVSIIVLVVVWIVIKESHFRLKRLKLQDGDLTITDRIFRYIFRIGEVAIKRVRRCTQNHGA
ncbi:ankyrin repeat-containing protein At5g02620-like [Salvia hispanica]|uniref:ankyrin repeat-containing protein At5g02620-like n=1 Tax=Salvia hispanica TaxID=49212 RepID=UPI002009C5E1|nr:ankyrin repeat-containing protein At5g02620-like [Salvia hispanica]